MQIIETASQTAIHPATLTRCKAISFKFDTGHRCTIAADGYRWYNRATGKALNAKSGHKLVAEMDRLIREAGA